MDLTNMVSLSQEKKWLKSPGKRQTKHALRNCLSYATIEKKKKKLSRHVWPMERCFLKLLGMLSLSTMLRWFQWQWKWANLKFPCWQYWFLLLPNSVWWRMRNIEKLDFLELNDISLCMECVPRDGYTAIPLISTLQISSQVSAYWPFVFLPVLAFQLKYWKQFHTCILKFGTSGDTTLGNALNKMDAKCGALDNSSRDVSWHAKITALHPFPCQ